MLQETGCLFDGLGMTEWELQYFKWMMTRTRMMRLKNRTATTVGVLKSQYPREYSAGGKIMRLKNLVGRWKMQNQSVRHT
jgi:hypothetical protein